MWVPLDDFLLIRGIEFPGARFADSSNQQSSKQQPTAEAAVRMRGVSCQRCSGGSSVLYTETACSWQNLAPARAWGKSQSAAVGNLKQPRIPRTWD